MRDLWDQSVQSGSQKDRVGWIIPTQSQCIWPNTVLANPSTPQPDTQAQLIATLTIIQSGSQNTIIQLTGVAGNITITPAPPPTAQGAKNEAPADQIGQRVSSFQHQSLRSRKKSEMSIEEDSQPCD
ncbi:uncharacterized protein MONOS_13915 [Monocercomonoides exilis]|uniref:uncharacterized protein n=1 Tax=Monocercomonoides exilis TaxID=2049356 RepID=UPI00355AC095|nr:hypothetical protein MONOS_13915 [Monocercomonoides exilis]|eukprot:MONOS_13915.1-p1 / transcript=MONOS_13915.1 / gene=MONOS_13915 / organism=Monocercomonoides_exilis_PA203 / gene_product=unspecified product / transcript_product=unspecified product / location=Mono_scaffold00903:13706-14226(+) / protein_length=127 / sequence_SO=supercontig / SO=protein_coding / is_pseudo=false